MKILFLLVFILVGYSLTFTQPKPYVVLISYDAFRWDYCERGITPNIDNLTENGVKAKSLRPCFPSKTFPNHQSIITGMYPQNHGIIANDIVDLETGEEFHLEDRKAVQNPKWYKGEAFWETAKKNNIKSASFFWPGSELDDSTRRPTYFKYYKHNFPYNNRVDTVISWLSLPYSKRPHFISTYFHDTDSYGHKYGPHSPELNESIKRLDNILGYFESELQKIGMSDSVNIILVSDHGMTEISEERSIEINKLLPDLDYMTLGEGPIMMIEAKENKLTQIVSELKLKQKHFNTYTKATMPEYYHFSKNDLIYSIILVADEGWSLITSANGDNWYLDSKGNHGYDNNLLDMHGMFIAKGPAFKENYKTGTLFNIDIYPLLCKIFRLNVDHKIDGLLERIEFILN